MSDGRMIVALLAIAVIHTGYWVCYVAFGWA
jgi:hypothetical protein